MFSSLNQLRCKQQKDGQEESIQIQMDLFMVIPVIGQANLANMDMKSALHMFPWFDCESLYALYRYDQIIQNFKSRSIMAVKEVSYLKEEN